MLLAAFENNEWTTARCLYAFKCDMTLEDMQKYEAMHERCMALRPWLLSQMTLAAHVELIERKLTNGDDD